MRFLIREMEARDCAAWTKMRAALWPDASEQLHAAEIETFLVGSDAWSFIAETTEGEPAGFAEVALRPYANGCESRPVPFLEGIWVEAQFRRQRLGAQLMAHIETFLAARGFREIGSDALIDNRVSHAAHRAWGYSETERVVYFRKVLNAPMR
jgi:aminoglycoside 6'-N-acetyltransferase I